MVSYDGLLRRAEVGTLRVEDLLETRRTTPDGQEFVQYSILLRKSKTDQERRGHWITLREITFLAIKRWLEVSGIKEGPLFRGITPSGGIKDSAISAGEFPKMLRRAATAAGFRKEVVEEITGHSVRVGAAQDMALANETLEKIASRGRWKMPYTALSYFRNLSHPQESPDERLKRRGWAQRRSYRKKTDGGTGGGGEQGSNPL